MRIDSPNLGRTRLDASEEVVEACDGFIGLSSEKAQLIEEPLAPSSGILISSSALSSSGEVDNDIFIVSIST